jgi:hypothetical protein
MEMKVATLKARISSRVVVVGIAFAWAAGKTRPPDHRRDRGPGGDLGQIISQAAVFTSRSAHGLVQPFDVLLTTHHHQDVGVLDHVIGLD